MVDLLGVPYDSLPSLPSKMTGIGGDVEACMGTGRIRWEGRTICDHFVVMRDLPILLLGRAEFFTKYDVRFVWSGAPPYFDVEPVS